MGRRFAVVGGGICGAAVAAALLHGARSRARSIDVRVYEGPEVEQLAGLPVVLTTECRSRLSALGCRVPIEWRAAQPEGVEIIARGERERIDPGPGGLWVLDAWGVGESGSELVARTLSAAAALEGARFLPRRVDRVERVKPLPSARAPNQPVETAELVVRAAGLAERYHSAVLAAGADSGLGDEFFPGFRGPPTVPAMHGRLRYPIFTHSERDLIRVALAPLPNVDALILVPAHRSVHATAFGPALTQSDFCQALMVAARDGLLPDGFELAELRAARLPFGAGPALTHRAQLAVGPAAYGHPLQLSLAESLAGCTRAALALLESGDDAAALERRYVHDGVYELLEGAVDASRAVGWLLRAGAAAPRAFTRARIRGPVASGYSSGVLGLSAPTPRALLRKSRGAALGEFVRGLFFVDGAHELAEPGATEPGLFYVVDDDAATRDALTAFLTERGAKVVAFGDELSLYAAVAQRRPQAVLLDVVLSWVDGLSLCQGLKTHPLTRDARVVVTSGLDRPHVRARAMAAGAAAFLPKPLDLAMLWAVLGGPPARSPGASAGRFVESAPYAS